MSLPMLSVTVVSLLIVNGVLGSIYIDHEKGIIDDVPREPFETLPDDPNAVYIEGDIQVDPNRNAISSDNGKWPNGEIPYVINSKYPATERAKIVAAMREIEADVNGRGKCIRFLPRTVQRNYITVDPIESTCSSFIGDAQRGGQQVKLGNGCIYRGIIMHELVHALGFYHEQSRPDRNNYVKVNLNGVLQTHRSNYNIVYNLRTFNTAYDYGSIMHYNPYEFSTDLSVPVMTPVAGKSVNVKMGQRSRLSKTDVIKIQSLYKCPVDASHIQHTDLECIFGPGNFCGLQLAGDFKWVLAKGKRANGPNADLSTGTGYYALATASGHFRKYAHLVTKVYTAQTLCITLNMVSYKGESILAIGILKEGGKTIKNVVAYKGQPYKQWYALRKEYVKDPTYAQYRVVISAKMDTNDIAIDDLLISEGHC